MLFVVQKVKSEKLEPFFKQIVETGYAALDSENIGEKDYETLAVAARDKFRKELARYVRQYSFISQIMTFTDPALEKFYLFAKLLLRKIPVGQNSLPREVTDMVDMDKFRVQEEQNGRITLALEDGTLELVDDDGHRGQRPEETEKLKLIVAKLNHDYGIPFEEADRVMNAMKEKLENDDALRAAFKTNSIEFLRKQKLQDSIREAFLSNADEFLNFMSKTETDPGFGKFFASEMFNWYSDSVKPSSKKSD